MPASNPPPNRFCEDCAKFQGKARIFVLTPQKVMRLRRSCYQGHNAKNVRHGCNIMERRKSLVNNDTIEKTLGEARYLSDEINRQRTAELDRRVAEVMRNEM